MRVLRSVYNKAVRKGLAGQTYPFKNVYTGIDRTRKRAVDERIIARFIGLDVSRSASLSLTRDLFLFSFYTRGMSFVDMTYLKRENIRNGRIRYIRRKTGQELVIRLEPEMQVFIEKESFLNFSILHMTNALFYASVLKMEKARQHEITFIIIFYNTYIQNRYKSIIKNIQKGDF